MPNIDALKADPAFQSLPPERQQAMLQHLSGGAPSAPSSFAGNMAMAAGGALAMPEQTYEQNLAQPTTAALEHVGIPHWAASNVVPQTKTGLALDAASAVLPELKAGRVLGEAAGPAARFIGGRLGRAATMGAVGAGASAMSGQSPLGGAAQGLGGELGAQATRGATGMVTRRVFKKAMLAKTLEDFGTSLTKAMPWLGKMKTTEDFGKALRGDGINKAMAVLRKAKSGINNDVQGLMFQIEDPADPSKMLQVPFHDADEIITKMQQRSYLPIGDPRTGATAHDWHELASNARERMVQQLDRYEPGLGTTYDNARKQADAAFTLFGVPSLQRGGVFRNKDIFNADGTLNQPIMLERMKMHANRLKRSLGDENVEGFLSTLKRGATGEVEDIPAKGDVELHANLTPHGVHAVAKPGYTYDAVGKVPKYYEPPHAPFEMGVQNFISGKRAQPPPPASVTPNDMTGRDKTSSLGNEANRQFAKAVVGTPNPSRVELVEKLNRNIKMGKQPDVATSLRQGRFSMPALQRLLAMQTQKTAPALMAKLGPVDKQHLLAIASPEEQEWLRPMIEEPA